MKRSDAGILDKLNPAQRSAVTHVDGPLLTLAGPGSGKTRVVTHRIAYLLEQGISPYSILALTFTNKAAQEMKARIASLTQDAPVWMGTFHGYCARFLRRYGNLVGLSPNFSIFDMDDAKKALQSAIELAQVSLTHLNFADISKAIGELKNRVVTPEMLEGDAQSPKERIIAKIYPFYQKLLLQNNAVDFDDMLMHTASILRSSPELRKDLDSKHRYILVDEYQDTNLAQYLIVRALSTDYPNLNVTGDPDQSIYSWRGADISNILNFERDFPSCKTVRLEENYRSTPEILSVADSLISCNTRRKAKRLLPTREAGAAVRLVSYSSARDEADNIADQIATAILENRGKPKDFAVLYRTNAHSRLLEAALLRRKLNYQLIGGFRFYHREEIKDLLAYLRLVHNPTDDISFQRVVNVPNRGLGDKSLEKVIEFARAKDIPMLVALRAVIETGQLSKKAASGARSFLAVYEKLVHLASGPLAVLLQTLVKETEYVAYLSAKKSDAPDESIQGNINELIADAAEVDRVNTDGNAIEQFLEQVTLLSDADGLTDSDSKVTLMTLHSAKGLEFPSVFIIAVEQEILPHVRSMRDPSQYEEERRLFFVGITRAKERLQLSTAKSRGFGNSKMGAPSPFLMELPRAEMELIDLSDNFGSDSGFESEFHGESYREDWESKSFLHRGSKKKAPAHNALNKSVNRRAAAPSEDEAYQPDNGSLSASNEDSFDSIPFHDFSDAPPSEGNTSEAVPAGLEDIMKKLSRGGRQIPSSGLKTAAQVTAATTLNGVPVDRFEEGDLVLHADYGQGTISSVEGRGARRMARITFSNGDAKSFRLSNSPIGFP
jgi:DNA helicase II / ATP-dependent DNA helicase PcrA